MKFAFASAGLIGVLLLGGCASPQPKVVSVEVLFKKADKSGDGRVSREEYQDFMVEQLFAMYDKNGDGFITVEEYVADGGTAEGFRKLNQSGTGKLSLEEAKKSALIKDRMAAPFDEADANHNGYVTWEEFQVARAKRQAYTR
ncbi:MAG TPA: EF-hand domain-containing protein [Chthoniobacterales bacterium]|jgi:Ca2+-binding EF-hand superfamily protein